MFFSGAVALGKGCLLLIQKQAKFLFATQGTAQLDAFQSGSSTINLHIWGLIPDVLGEEEALYFENIILSSISGEMEGKEI